MIQTARIALSRPLRRLFDYEIPDGMALEPGQRVRIPFGRQSLVGIVVATGIAPPAGITLKPVSATLENWPVLPPETRELLQWAATYYQHPLGECLFMGLPPALRRGRPATLKAEVFWEPVPGGDNLRLPSQARQQKALYEWLEQRSHPVRQTDIQSQGYTLAQIRGLAKKELIRTAEGNESTGTDESLDTLPELTPAQSHAFHDIPAPDTGFSATLLYGITGSGKTEVYLHYLKAHLKNNQQSLVLVPEINLTPQTVRRFTRYFGSRICVWHSALNDGERLQTWLRIRNGEPVIVIGTRSAVTLPFINPGVIVVDEEHDTSYKQGEGFRYSGRDLAVYRAHLNQCPILLGSATPSIESYHNATTGKYRLVKLEERVGDAKPPTMRLLDIRSRPLEGGLSPRALQAMRERIDRDEQVLIFVNRRGFAPVMMCFDCGYISECPRCDSRLTYHRRDRALRCHHCDYQMAAPATCPDCDSEAYKPIGQGTERTEDVLQDAFPDTPIIRVDRDSTRNRGSISRILSTVNSGKPCILVGTQMLAKGHDFPNVSLVVVVNADGGLFSVDFRAPEQLVQTLLQVSGRAGRGKIPGTVLIQTCHSEHPLLNQLCDGHYLSMADHILKERAQVQMPPFRAMALLRAEAATMEDSLALLDNAKQQIRDSRLETWGPLPAVIARRADRHRAQLIILCDHKGPLQQTFAALCSYLDNLRKPASLKWQVDIDPLETG